MQNVRRIELHPISQRVQMHVDGKLLADTTQTFELREIGNPLRQYIPREDVRMDFLKPYKTETHYPLKVGTAQFLY
ncbi:MULTISPECIES: DUF427 domain-containing protein [Halomonadaceae]|uniref:DUF427 domain-containing protein n=1 Tax=Vreelandella glaciei TaxID=186761 RepID=A0A7Z0RYJ4_9GAMM|nr:MULTISPECIES: DUF427 domain-containing protein [Halomonas]AJY50038.1 protein of unknown function DUF427 [Halomonas sp. KO116]NYS78286.1 DUF427 domain-containing protein [Halomonas glaciei]|tara:strand:+ start:808 stop:1035 length:228 start_codon:yes stop_codon:yes gene_type:complete